MPLPPQRPIKPGAVVEKPKPGRRRRNMPSHTPSAVLSIAHAVAMKAHPPFDNVLEFLLRGEEVRVRNICGPTDWLTIQRWRNQQ